MLDYANLCDALASLNVIIKYKLMIPFCLNDCQRSKYEDFYHVISTCCPLSVSLFLFTHLKSRLSFTTHKVLQVSENYSYLFILRDQTSANLRFEHPFSCPITVILHDNQANLTLTARGSTVDVRF